MRRAFIASNRDGDRIMGLDTYADKAKELNVDFASIAGRLCGGIMSQTGEASFRGKVYDDFVESVAGASLYQEWINPYEVKDIALALTKYVAEHTPKSHHQYLLDNPMGITHLDFDEAKALAEWFTIASDNELAVRGWW